MLPWIARGGGGFRVYPEGLRAVRVLIGDTIEQVTAADIPPDGTLAYERERLPTGGWELDYGDAGILTHRFGGEVLSRAAVGMNAWRPGLSLYLCTDLLQLAPGDHISVWQELMLHRHC